MIPFQQVNSSLIGAEAGSRLTTTLPWKFTHKWITVMTEHIFVKKALKKV